MFIKKVMTLALLDFFPNLFTEFALTHDNELVCQKLSSKYNYFRKYHLSSVYPVLRPVTSFRINISYSDAKNQDKGVEIFIFLFIFILDYVI